MSHANARLTPAGRLIMVQRIGSGRALRMSRRRWVCLARPCGGGGGGVSSSQGWRVSTAFRTLIDAHGITQRFIKPHCPWANGKAERLNQTLATEWAYARPDLSDEDRAAALPAWLDCYNLDRAHLGIGGKTPIDRINNGRRQYI